MISLLSRAAVRAIDGDAVRRLGLPSLVLMENAALGALAALERGFADDLGHVLILGGTGQNGGDGWCLARHLHNRGHVVTPLLLGPRGSVTGDAAINLDVVERLGIKIETLPTDGAPDAIERALRPRLERATMVVDGIFGTGLDRPIGGSLAEVIRQANASGLPCLALDMPSGIDADTGAVLGVAIRATRTITFAAHKQGLHQYPGVEHAGAVELSSIGVPPPDLSLSASPRDGGLATVRKVLFEPADAAVLLPGRPRDLHKGRAGHVVIVGGSAGKTGAPCLAARGALRTGAGLVTIATRPEVLAAVEAKVLEAMTMALTVDDLPTAVAEIEALTGRVGAVMVGPGLGVDATGRNLCRHLALDLQVPTVLDADALSAFAGDVAALRAAKGPRVLTPHSGEAARLLGVTPAEVQADRYGAAERLAELSGQVIVLKGARTIIAMPVGHMRVCRRGTPALATAGTGDVLAGVVAGLLPTLGAGDAASVAVVLHAVAGELEASGDRGLVAGDVADGLAAAIAFCRAEAG